MQDSKLTVESFSVSFSMETHRGGEKRSHFVNATVRAEPPVPIEDFALARLEASVQVTKAVYQDAVARGDMSQEDAVERLGAVRDNYSVLRENLMRARDLKASR